MILNKKNIFSFFLVFFLSVFGIFSLDGTLADSSSPLKVIKTQYFDIIFPEEAMETAKKIEAVCDDYYLEITAKLETEAYQRFPVTITRSVEMMNAYYSAIPYNRIVLYDTLPETSLDMYEDTIQSVFYHELTHAVTYNMKSKWGKRLSFISDALNPAWLSVTTFWAEGATVSFESKGRGGRLNDPFSTQMVNQSVIENHFPSWRDVTGARDSFPGGTDGYMFGSMFASYLQEKYGMSKYADFWKNAGSMLKFSFIASVFKKTYGRSITEEWKEFEKTLPLEHGAKNVKALSHKKARVQTFDFFFDEKEGECKIAYFDSASSSLRLLTLDDSGKVKKNKKLLAITGITRVSFSPDGNKLALTRYVDRKNYKSVTGEYDLTKKKYSEHEKTGRRDAYYRIYRGKSYFSEIPLFTPDNAAGLEPYFYSHGEIPFSPVWVSENLSAAIIKDSLSWKIRLYDVGRSLYEYDFSNISESRNLIIHKLHLLKSDDSCIWLSFTWAELGMGGKMLSRVGLLKIDRNSLQASAYLQKENAFAGVLEAVPYGEAALSCLEEDSQEPFPVFLVAAEYDKNPLYSMNMKADDFEKIELSFEKLEENAEKNLNLAENKEGAEANLSSAAESSSFASYNPLRYYMKGVFLPLIGCVPIYDHDFKQNSMTSLGLTFVSANPWGDKIISFSSGYDPIYSKGGGQIAFSGGNDSFQYALSGTCIFDKDGFMQTVDTLQISKTLWSGKIASFTAGSLGNFLYGRQIIDDYFEDNIDESEGKSADGLLYLQFSNVHKISPKPFNMAGFTFRPFLLASYRDSENRIELDKYVNGGAQAQLRFPVFFPFIFTASLFPSHKYAASGSVQAILASLEIHKGIPALSLFMQRLVFTASYNGKISYAHGERWDIKDSYDIFRDVKKDDYSDALSLSCDLYFTPNTGFYANGDNQYKIGCTMLYRPNPKSNEKKIAGGLTFSLNN